MSMRSMAASFVLLLSSMMACADADSQLEGTAWRLLNITSMDDSVSIPEEPGNYTLSFEAEGRFAIKADCNQASGNWSSGSTGQLMFSAMAATRALCPPGSLSESYLAQFEWVRSYTKRDGHLLLATMADGSIIEFDPLPPIAATAFGEALHASDASELQSMMVTRVLDRYAAERDLRVEDAELTVFVDNMRRGMAAEGLTADEGLTAEEMQQVDAMRRKMGFAMIRQWKINKSLYKTYGGRIIYQQLGPEPLDAYRQYFEQRQTAGDFTFENPVMEAQFWDYFSNESRHEFMERGGVDESRAFTTPPWETHPE